MEWTRGHIIGQGSSATVYLATTTSSSSSSSAAVSAVKSAELSQSQHLQREQKIVSSLSSLHTVTYKGFDITKENNNKLMFNLFMEYMPFGTLSHHGGRLREPVIAHYTKQVVMGLEYLHSKGLVHCDIKGSNILVGEGGVVKIGDFGCARLVNEAAPVAGTPAFMSPEAARGEEQGCPCDVWALGCTVVEMATGCSPWPNVGDPVSVLYRVGYCGDVPEVPSFLSDEAKDFLGKCFRRNPRERWSASQLLSHPFLGEFSSKGGDGVHEESNSCSPTSILDQGFWNSVEESECPLIGNLVHTCLENSPSDRIRKLALCSGDPSWNWDSENWITTRGNEAWAEVEGSCNCGSMAASNSVGDWCDLGEVEEINVSGRISGYFCEDFKCKDVRVVAGSLNFERGIAEMLLPLTLDIL